jgi:hypothetical protein
MTGPPPLDAICLSTNVSIGMNAHLYPPPGHRTSKVDLDSDQLEKSLSELLRSGLGLLGQASRQNSSVDIPALFILATFLQYWGPS